MALASRVHKTDLFNKKFENIDFKYTAIITKNYITRKHVCKREKRKDVHQYILLERRRQLDDLEEGIFNVK